MNYPSFYDEVKTIKTYDPLAQFLGAVEDGIIEYNYIEVVKIAGHSCATVAGAYLITIKALNALYPNDEIPVRGNIFVEFAGKEVDGVVGVVGNVVSIITGAKGCGGFKGIDGNYSRNNLLKFGVDGLQGDIRFTRLDNYKSVEVVYTPAISADSNTNNMISAILRGKATPFEVLDFKSRWQSRVKGILIDHFDDENQIRFL